MQMLRRVLERRIQQRAHPWRQHADEERSKLKTHRRRIGQQPNHRGRNNQRRKQRDDGRVGGRLRHVQAIVVDHAQHGPMQRASQHAVPAQQPPHSGATATQPGGRPRHSGPGILRLAWCAQLFHFSRNAVNELGSIWRISANSPVACEYRTLPSGARTAKAGTPRLMGTPYFAATSMFASMWPIHTWTRMKFLSSKSAFGAWWA